MPDYRHVVRDAYLDILRREPDPAGLAAYDRALNTGLSEQGLREGLLRSAEFALRFPEPSPADMALHVEGNQFVDARGRLVRLLGAIVCCRDAQSNGWPLVSLDALDLFAGHRLNYTHCRLGPFTLAGEGDVSNVGYVTTGDGRVDLEQFFPGFWERARDIARHAVTRNLYVEFDLVDRWVREHGATDLPAIDPWSARNNIQGIEAGGLAIFEHAPQPIHQRWVRKAVAELGEFPSVLFQVGNEGFKRFSAAWEVGVYDIVKDELRLRGFPDRLVATNTHDAGLEARLDYVTRHAPLAQAAGAKPILVNEYDDDLSPDEVIAQVRRARSFGTAFMYWRGDHDQAQWDETLARLEAEVEPALLAALALETAPDAAGTAVDPGATRSRARRRRAQ